MKILIAESTPKKGKTIKIGTLEHNWLTNGMPLQNKVVKAGAWELKSRN